MSRTYRNTPTHIFRSPKTLNELRQVNVSPDFYDDEYNVSMRHHVRYWRTRWIPSAWDDLKPSSYQQQDHHS
jgi:hypothetical protein